MMLEGSRSGAFLWFSRLVVRVVVLVAAFAGFTAVDAAGLTGARPRRAAWQGGNDQDQYQGVGSPEAALSRKPGRRECWTKAKPFPVTKTLFCRFLSKGRCDRSDNCTYAHETREMDLNNVWKTQECTAPAHESAVAGELAPCQLSCSFYHNDFDHRYCGEDMFAFWVKLLARNPDSAKVLASRGTPTLLKQEDGGAFLTQRKKDEGSLEGKGSVEEKQKHAKQKQVADMIRAKIHPNMATDAELMDAHRKVLDLDAYDLLEEGTEDKARQREADKRITRLIGVFLDSISGKTQPLCSYTHELHPYGRHRPGIMINERKDYYMDQLRGFDEDPRKLSSSHVFFHPCYNTSPAEAEADPQEDPAALVGGVDEEVTGGHYAAGEDDDFWWDQVQANLASGGPSATSSLQSNESSVPPCFFGLEHQSICSPGSMTPQQQKVSPSSFPVLQHIPDLDTPQTLVRDFDFPHLQCGGGFVMSPFIVDYNSNNCQHFQGQNLSNLPPPPCTTVQQEPGGVFPCGFSGGFFPGSSASPASSSYAGSTGAPQQQRQSPSQVGQHDPEVVPLFSPEPGEAAPQAASSWNNMLTTSGRSIPLLVHQPDRNNCQLLTNCFANNQELQQVVDQSARPTAASSSQGAASSSGNFTTCAFTTPCSPSAPDFSSPSKGTGSPRQAQPLPYWVEEAPGCAPVCNYVLVVPVNVPTSCSSRAPVLEGGVPIIQPSVYSPIPVEVGLGGAQQPPQQPSGRPDEHLSSYLGPMCFDVPGVLPPHIAASLNAQQESQGHTADNAAFLPLAAGEQEGAFRLPSTSAGVEMEGSSPSLLKDSQNFSPSPVQELFAGAPLLSKMKPTRPRPSPPPYPAPSVANSVGEAKQEPFALPRYNHVIGKEEDGFAKQNEREQVQEQVETTTDQERHQEHQDLLEALRRMSLSRAPAQQGLLPQQFQPAM
ncbi:unnamed protein product, partial [Amoebophrya sp. A25]|eukprot:GSA25T00002857001.1